MVNTRSASRQSSSLGDETPTLSSTRAKSSPSKATTTGIMATSKSSSSSPVKTWSHAPTKAALAWLAISLPLVLWDVGYLMLRPHTMEGGALEWPLWIPYRIYARVDYVYGWKAFQSGDGFPAAQALLNLIETVMYAWYAYVFVVAGSGARVAGRAGAVGLLVGFSAAAMTLSKTVLYGAHEYYSGFDNIRHNTVMDLTMYYIIPNGAWLVGSTYLVWQLGGDIINGLVTASAAGKTE